MGSYLAKRSSYLINGGTKLSLVTYWCLQQCDGILDLIKHILLCTGLHLKSIAHIRLSTHVEIDSVKSNIHTGLILGCLIWESSRRRWQNLTAIGSGYLINQLSRRICPKTNGISICDISRG